jgi:hypothetical protein
MEGHANDTGDATGNGRTALQMAIATDARSSAVRPAGPSLPEELLPQPIAPQGGIAQFVCGNQDANSKHMGKSQRKIARTRPRKGRTPSEGRGNYEFRERRSYRFVSRVIPEEFRKFARERLLPTITLLGYRPAQKTELAIQALHNLVLTGQVGACVADSRDTGRPGVRLHTQVWDAIIEAGYAHLCLGSEVAGKVTRYAASDTLIDLFLGWKLAEILDLKLARNTRRREPTALALIILRTGTRDLTTGKKLPRGNRKKPLPLPRFPAQTLAVLRSLEDRIERVNWANLQHTWQAYYRDPETGKRRIMQPNPCLRQIHCGRLGRAARLYSWSPLSGQSLPKEMRRSMRIDGERVAELDYSGHATRCLYHRRGINPPKGDVYRPEVILPRFHQAYERGYFTDEDKAVARNFIKKVTNVCWNVRSERDAVGSVWKLVKQDEFLKRLVFCVEGTGPRGIVNRIRHAHPDLADDFFTEVGAELMTLDGELMLEILERFADAGRPALALHDAILVRRSDAAFGRRTMIDVYRQKMGFSPVVRRSF